MNRTPSDPHDDRWLLRARDLLREQSEQGDPTLQRQLQQRRRRALEASEAGRGLRLPRPVLAVAGSLLVVLAVWQLPSLDVRMPGSGQGGPVAAAPALRAESPIDQALTLPEDDLALLLGEVDHALVEELEFYAWLEQQNHGG